MSQSNTKMLHDAAWETAPDCTEAGQIFMRVCETLDQAGIPYCILHGYESYPQHIGSDVDILVDAAVTPDQLVALLQDNRTGIGAEIVSVRGYCLVLAGQSPASCLTLDFSVQCEVDGWRLCEASAVLAGRRRHRQFWVPDPATEFAWYLARTILKASLDAGRAMRLSSLYLRDPGGCRIRIESLWRGRNLELIMSAARSGDWRAVIARLPSIGDALRRSSARKWPGRLFRSKVSRLKASIQRLWQPAGLSVVMLGPDGAGKSSAVEALPARLSHVFSGSKCWGFAPPLHRLIRRGPRSTDQPHALPPRGGVASVLRAGYWLVYAIGSDVVLRLVTVRATLVLFDRHFVDVLVDTKRYRYGGPKWLLQFIWRCIPKPDLIILLDAPAGVLHERKQEVPFEETVAQRNAYLTLVSSLRNSHVVDARQSRDLVADDAARIILRHLATRTAARTRPNERS
jgi:thymidylate kinase